VAKDDQEQLQAAEDPSEDQEELTKRVLRQHNLPTGGDFPFIPPKYWRPHQPLRKNSKGAYIDSKARRWRKGPTRTKGEGWEWDVQLPNGDHLNIDWGGNITHPKPKANRTKDQPHRGLGGKRKQTKKQRHRDM
jgi:hypothetical protein